MRQDSNCKRYAIATAYEEDVVSTYSLTHISKAESATNSAPLGGGGQEYSYVDSDEHTEPFPDEEWFRQIWRVARIDAASVMIRSEEEALVMLLVATTALTPTGVRAELPWHMGPG